MTIRNVIAFFTGESWGESPPTHTHTHTGQLQKLIPKLYRLINCFRVALKQIDVSGHKNAKADPDDIK